MLIEDKVVQIDTTFVEQTASQAGFGTLLYVPKGAPISARTKSFSSVSEMTSAGIPSDTNLVKAATAYFSQEVKPQSLLVGRRRASSINVAVDSVSDGDVFTITINGDDASTTAGASDTTTTISAALTTAINGLSQPVTATDNTGDLDVAADTATDLFSLVATAGDVTLTFTYDDTVTDDLNNILDDNNNFYGIAFYSRTKADILDVAAFAETNDKLYGYASADADILTSGTTDVAADLKDQNYDRTFGLYHPDAATNFPDTAWFGTMLPRAPGSATWAYKTLTGIAGYDLTQSETTNATGKFINLYVPIGGSNVTWSGILASERYIDIRRGVDWLKQRVKERIQALLVSKDKIPYTNAGRDLILNVVRAQFDEAVANDVIAEGYNITAPNVLDAPAVDRENRILRNVVATARLAGAIHEVRLEFVLSF